MVLIKMSLILNTDYTVSWKSYIEITQDITTALRNQEVQAHQQAINVVVDPGLEQSWSYKRKRQGL